MAYYIAIADTGLGENLRFWNKRARAFCDTAPKCAYDTYRGASRAYDTGLPYHAWLNLLRQNPDKNRHFMLISETTYHEYLKTGVIL